LFIKREEKNERLRRLRKNKKMEKGGKRKKSKERYHPFLQLQTSKVGQIAE
jgi:hypothetical protein